MASLGSKAILLSGATRETVLCGWECGIVDRVPLLVLHLARASLQLAHGKKIERKRDPQKNKSQSAQIRSSLWAKLGHQT